MGLVYRALDLKLDRHVALKFLPPELTRDPDARQRFTHEAKAASALQHSNICTIHDIDESTDGRIFIVMDFYDGETLNKRIERGPLAIDDALEFSIQIARGLCNAHQQGIVHRDIKPANIFLTQDGQAKILDFGLAKLAGRTMLTREGQRVGTAAYMSPEQARGEEVDQRTDIWAFGALLYEMISGRSPFPTDYEQALVYRILNEDPEPLTALRPDAPKELERIVAKAMRKDPANRYQEMGDMLAELQQLKRSSDSGPVAIPVPPRARKQPVWIYALIAALVIVVALTLLLLLPSDDPQIDSIAVLPLANLTQDPEQEFFADGMTNALINELGQISGLSKVSSRTSVMQYKNAGKPLPDIARELGVAAVVEGSVQLIGQRVGVTVQLIDASADRQIWANSYERDYRDIISLQREVAHAIAREIRVTLTETDQERLTRKEVVDPKAHTLYLKGVHLLDQDLTKREAVEKSIEYFWHAIQIDSMYAAPYAGLANASITLAGVGYRSAISVAADAKWAANKALELDPGSARAHLAKGSVLFSIDWNWKGALEYDRRAIELNPNDSEAHLDLANDLSIIGRPDEAIPHMQRAQELNPLSLNTNVQAVRMFTRHRMYDRAIQEAEEVLMLYPDDVFARYSLAIAYAHKGEYDTAIEIFLSRKVSSPGTNPMLGYTYGMAGRRDEAQRVLDFLLEKSKGTFVPHSLIAAVYIGLDKKEKALDFLEQGFEEHDTWIYTFKVDPMWDRLRGEPRFEEMLQAMNFPETPDEPH